jgi:diguanylate cyclase (GGDEF)-like protein
VLAEMADGLALFDEDGKLVLCNEQYHSMFPLTRDVRVPGASLTSILRVAAERGEQGHMPPDRLEAWIAEIASLLKTGGDEEVHLFDGRWLQLRTTVKPGIGATSVVSDVTAIKKAERELSALTDQLKLLATTDGLTTLMNRRAFDDCLEKEIARTRRSGLPISLIMIDIDRFKAFNDRYGHPAGDECLRRVADVLRRNVKRPADSVARYGGEEFGVILPDTDEDGAYFLAEELRKSVRGLHLEHDKSEKNIVTISLGVATYPSSETKRSSLELISRADEALYTAKGAGRDRVNGWVASVAARSGAA